MCVLCVCWSEWNWLGLTALKHYEAWVWVLWTAAVNLNVKDINISLSGGRWCLDKRRDCCLTSAASLLQHHSHPGAKSMRLNDNSNVSVNKSRRKNQPLLKHKLNSLWHLNLNFLPNQSTPVSHHYSVTDLEWLTIISQKAIILNFIMFRSETYVIMQILFIDIKIYIFI